MKNIIAYSLWGDGLMYWKGALENIKLNNIYFPDWISRFYIDKTCKKELIETIKGDNVEVILVEMENSFSGMFSRFYAASDPNVNIMLSRDCDSRLSDREFATINEWIASDKDFHIMRDHPFHTVPILGGMWGCRNGLLKNMNNYIAQWDFFAQKGCDQDFLGQLIYPIIKDRALEHSEFGLKYGGDIKPFPTERKNYEFIGDVFDENNVRHPDYWKIIKNYDIRNRI